MLVSVVASDAWNQGSVSAMVGTAVFQLVAGALIGLIIARIGQVLLSRISLPSAGLYPLATLTIAMAAFATAGVAHGSGLLAAYVAGIWLAQLDSSGSSQWRQIDQQFQGVKDDRVPEPCRTTEHEEAGGQAIGQYLNYSLARCMPGPGERTDPGHSGAPRGTLQASGP